MMHLHFIGVGGIGMSGLAAAFCDLGYRISGSDRGAENPENSHIISPLREIGVTIYPQDGSYIADGVPDALVYSTAIEEDNPDLIAGKSVRRLHRSEMLKELIRLAGEKQFSIAVTGSCGKSTVYLAEAMLNLGADPRSLNGAVSKRFASGNCVGNYRSGNGRYFVFEADESDKSLLNYSADYAVILNIGTGKQYLRYSMIILGKKFIISIHQFALTHSGSCLLAGHICRMAGKTQLSHTHADGTGGNQHDFIACVF